MSTPRSSPTRVTVRAPATSANLGPGFDCLGLALDLWNEVTGTRVDPSTEAAVLPPPPGPYPRNLVLAGVAEAYRCAGEIPCTLQLRSNVRIPIGRGLGSSAAAIACGLLIGNGLLGNRWSESHLLEMANTIEGHPDNVVPALLGGVRASIVAEDGSVMQSLIPLGGELRAVVFVPRVALPTAEARAVLPLSVPFEDAVFNVGRTGLLVAALTSGSKTLIGEAMRDRLHQDYRAPLFPAGKALIQCARDAGALGACVSGAGPSILALCDDAAASKSILGALRSMAAAQGVRGRALALAITTIGAHVVHES